MQTETRTFKDEAGRMQFDFTSVGKFRFRYPYLIEARQFVEGLQKLMATQLMEDQLENIYDEMNKLKSEEDDNEK